jgi:hypothetical protein
MVAKIALRKLKRNFKLKGLMGVSFKVNLKSKINIKKMVTTVAAAAP